MPVTIRPSGAVKAYTSGNARVSLPAGETIREMLVRLGIPPEIIALVLVNDVPQDKDYLPVDGDVIQILAVIGGG